MDACRVLKKKYWVTRSFLGMGRKYISKLSCRRGRMQLTSRMGKSIKNWLGCLSQVLTLLRQRLKTTGKHVLYGRHNVLNNCELSPTCKNWENSSLSNNLSFPTKLEIGITWKASYTVTVWGSRAAAAHLYTGVCPHSVPVATCPSDSWDHLPGAQSHLHWPPRLQAIRAKIPSLWCFTLSSSNINSCYKDPFLL